jgi:DNA-directed RNA polymerase specialized sigma24 family protein
MVSDADARTIGLFFLFTLMEEKAALGAAQKAIIHLKSRKRSGTEFDREDLVAALHRVYQNDRKLVPRNQLQAQLHPAPQPSIDERTHYLNAGSELTAWTRFHREAGENEIVAVTLSRILGISDQAIAAGLGISLGSARYRIGKGIRQLGAVLRRAKA